MHRTFVKPATPLHINKNTFRYVPKYVAKGSAVSPLAQQIQVRRNLPFLKPVNGAGPLKSRLAAPINAQPKLTLVKAPKPALTPRFGPFVQRHWKKAFFWVAVAGIGYLTVPEYYYDRFLGYVDGFVLLLGTPRDQHGLPVVWSWRKGKLTVDPLEEGTYTTTESVVRLLGNWSVAHSQFVVAGNEAGMLLDGEVRGADAAVWRRAGSRVTSVPEDEGAVPCCLGGGAYGCAPVANITRGIR